MCYHEPLTSICVNQCVMIGSTLLDPGGEALAVRKLALLSACMRRNVKISVHRFMCTCRYFYHVAQLSKPAESAYKTVKTRSTVYIHPGSGTPSPAACLSGCEFTTSFAPKFPP